MVGDMMLEINMKNLPKILLTVGFFMLVTGCGASYITGLKEDHQNVNKRMVDVSETYKAFETNTKLFEEERDILHKTTLSDTYYDVFYTNDKGIKNALSNYEAMLDEIYKKVTTLDSLCKNIYYSDKEVNNKCNEYKFVYEQVHNIFINDILEYNETVNNFNRNDKNKQLNLYETNKKYVDYNNDKKYAGK